MSNNYLCLCGHKQSEHTILMPTGKRACNFLAPPVLDYLNQFDDYCVEFQLDNLRYLEDLSREQ